MMSQVEAALRRLWVPTPADVESVVEGRAVPARSRIDVVVPWGPIADESHGL